MSAIDVDGGGTEVDLGLTIVTVDAQGALPAAQLDTAAAALVAGSSATNTAVRAVTRPYGNLTIGFGDSVMQGSDAPTTYAIGGSWFSRTCEISGQQLRFLRNSGIAGNRTDQMLARFQADVIAYAPNNVVIEAVTPNDPGTLTLAQSKANIIAMIDMALAAHIRVMVCTGPPNNTAATNNQMRALSAWLIQYANSLGLVILDLYTPLVDPATGMYLAAYTADGIHPNILGQERVANFIVPRLPADLIRVPILSAGSGDASTLLSGGAFAVDSNADGIADGWTVQAGATGSLIATSDGTGNLQRINGGASGGYLVASAPGGSWSIGDRISMAGLWAQQANATVTVQVTCTGGTPYSQPRMLSSRTGVVTVLRTFYEEFIVPVGTTLLQARLVPGTNGTADFSQVTMRNMTRDLAI